MPRKLHPSEAASLWSCILLKQHLSEAASLWSVIPLKLQPAEAASHWRSISNSLYFEVFSNNRFVLPLQEAVSGVVVIQSTGQLPHQGITLTMEGAVNLQLSAKSVGLFEAFYNSLKVQDMGRSRNSYGGGGISLRLVAPNGWVTQRREGVSSQTKVPVTWGWNHGPFL